MAELLSPNPSSTERKQRPSMASRLLQSPTSPFFLGSNDDQLERAQARAARAAAIRRKSFSTAAPPPPSDPCFSKQQLSELFQNCIKLASENKINQKNTWELTLIDHLSELIKVGLEDETETETNFQKASCTLEAGVKIYGLRVDYVHAEAYKVLGGINRARLEDEHETIVDRESISGGQNGSHTKKDVDRKISPITTLEPSFEVLNVKKFDVAFSVDPLYHQTSAQFDEGGAKGLLLNNLGVYGYCSVVFDSLESPGKCMSCAPQRDKSDLIDISFAKEDYEDMVINMSSKNEISPTLRNIISQFDEYNRRSSDTFSAGLGTKEQTESAHVFGDNQADSDGHAFDNFEACGFDQDDQASMADENCYNTDPTFPSQEEENDSFMFNGPDISDRFEEVTDFMFRVGSKSNNAWAGPDHWKFRKAKDSGDISVTENGSPVTAKRSRTKPQVESDIDFTKSLDSEMLNIFAKPKNPKLLILPANRMHCNTTLPEDCHYQPEELVKLFLLPNVMCLGKRARKVSDESKHDGDFGPESAWDNGSVDDQFDGVHSETEDSSTLVSQPRQVNKIEVQYDKTSKQVDVHVLKGTIWNHMQETVKQPDTGHEEVPVSFRQLLSSFPDDCEAAAPEDISPHLCFICLLHLANEHGLRILDNPNLDDLQIHF